MPTVINSYLQDGAKSRLLVFQNFRTRGNFCIQGHWFFVHRKCGRILSTHKRNSLNKYSLLAPFSIWNCLLCKTIDYSRRTESHAAGNQPLAGSVCRQDGREVWVGKALKHTLLPKLARKSIPVKVGTFLGVLQGHISGPGLLPCAQSDLRIQRYTRML